MSPLPASPRPEIQFADLEQQGETAQLGMWVFLATEVLFFGGIMAGYLAYRTSYQHEFVEAAKESVIWIGALNTAILLTSSLTMVLAIHAAMLGDRRLLVRLLLATALLGIIFLCLKGFEYWKDYEDGVVPVLNFHLDTTRRGPAELFWLFYFYATGLHAIHLTIGVVLVLVFTVRASRGAFTPEYYAPLEVLGLYWSFIDVVWCFLFALIYPLGRSF